MTKEILLKVDRRETGKGNARKIRKKNFVPAIVYGSGIKNQLLSLDIRILEKYLKSQFENSIFVLDSDIKELTKKHVLIKKISRDSVSRKPIHVDFYALDMANRVKVSVEIKFEGKSKGEQAGGQLEIQIRNLEIECLPSNIPSHLQVDVSDLDIGDNIHISDIKLPDGVKFTSSEDIAVCSVKQIKEEVVEAKPTEEEEADKPEPEKAESKDSKETKDTSEKKS